MCKEMPVIPVNRVVDPKRIIGKMEGRGGGEVRGIADPPKMYSLPVAFLIIPEFDPSGRPSSP
jgi:hypothetical protein